jgi:threonine/homoserine/homoserine lactone efflux protein
MSVSILQGLGIRTSNGRARDERVSPCPGFRNGLLLYCLSLQAAIFYLAFLPRSEFTGLNWQTAVIAIGIGHALLRLAWYAGLIRMTEPLQALISGPVVQRGMKHATGAVFLLISRHALVART